MLLILTNSLDGTTDELVRRIGSKHVFRFNVDLWREYEIEIEPGRFSLTDPFGRTLESHHVKTCYVRKPTFDDPLDVPAGGCVEGWLRGQIGYVNQELYNLCKRQGKVRLVEKGAQSRFGKFLQMEVAACHFKVPAWRFTKRRQSPEFNRPTVAKALTADFVENYKFFYATQVESHHLDPEYPWFLQEEVEANFDLTVVYVAGRSFAFTLAREFEGVDWRKHINKKELPWRRHLLSSEQEDRIHNFMVESELEFGRLDFLLSEEELYFLEVNPNGQWAWLDKDGSEGVFDAVVAILTRDWMISDDLHRTDAQRPFAFVAST